MTTLTTIVKYRDQAHEFLHPAAETIGQLLDGAIDYYQLDGSHELIADGDHLPIDHDVQLDDHALRDRLLKCQSLRLVPTQAVS